jgi:Cu-Zn family superoxide dismutase
MAKKKLLALSVIAAAVCGAAAGALALRAGAGPNELRAHATIVGNGITGEARFIQAPVDKNLPEPTVEVEVMVKGEALAPGRHGFHIHENASCDPPAFLTAGGHFDPGPFGNSTPVDANHPFHAGDLPNLEVNEAGVGHLQATTSRITLSPGPLSVFDANGSAVIVHLNPDQGINGVAGASGGPRVACGVIELD